MSHPAWVCGLKLLNRALITSYTVSHPAWVCGLKLLLLYFPYNLLFVTPCVGVWIETYITNKYTGKRIVTPCVGVWIETVVNGREYNFNGSHTLRGCVD